MSWEGSANLNGVSRRRFFRSGAALAAGASLSGSAASPARAAPGAADTVLRNGKVVTVAGKRTAEAVAISAAGSLMWVRAVAPRRSSPPRPR